MSSLFQIFTKIRGSLSNNYVYIIYYSSVVFIIGITLFSVFFPYQMQSTVYKYLGDMFSRTQILKVVLPNNSEHDRMSILSLVDELKQRYRKIIVKEIECEKNLSPTDMLIKGKGDLAIASSISCLTLKDKFSAISSSGEKAIYIIAPKNYGFNEFHMLAGKRIGFLGDISTGIYIIERLINFYNLDVPPELSQQRIYDIEKSFSSGEITAVVWTEEVYSSSIRKLLENDWYQIVPIRQSDSFTKTIPGLYVKHLDILPIGSIDLICVKNILIVSKNLSHSSVRKIVHAWFSSDSVLNSSEYDPTLKAFIPPGFLGIHPVAWEYFNKDKPITRKELITLGILFILILISILLLKQLFYIWLKRKNKPYEKELEKMWEEMKSLKCQWEIRLSNEEILIRLKKIKSLYNWALESYKNKFISEKSVLLFYLNILHQLIEFNERYFEYMYKKQTISELLQQETGTPSIIEKNIKTQELQSVSQVIVDNKDKYLKSPIPQQFSQEQTQQLLLFNSEEENKTI